MSFLRRSCLLLILFALLLSSSSLAEAREQVGVLEFTGSDRAEFRSAAAYRLTRILLDLDRFHVIDRAEMDRILSEQHFQMTGLVDIDTAVEAGNILGISQAFLGHIDRLSSSWDSSSRTHRAEARITVKVVDVQTSTLLHIIEVSGSGSDSDRITAHHRAIESALGESFITQLRSRFSITSIITRVDGRTVYMVGGQDMGIRAGYRYRIMRPDDPGDFDDAFLTEVGLLEIEDVTASRSRGRIIYSTEPVRQNDIAKEVPYNTRGLVGVEMKTLGYSLNNGAVTGMSPLIQVSYETERPYNYSWGGNIGLTSIKGMMLLNLGLEGGYEIPVSPGNLYLSVRGGGGFYAATQEHTYHTSGSASAASFYINGNGGIKYYLDYERGMRVNLGAGLLFGGSLSSWEDDNDRNVTDYVTYKDVNINGFSLMASLRIPLGFVDF